MSLYFGAGWLLVVPQFPGEGYFRLERTLSGFGLTLLSAAMLAGAGWLWTRLGAGVHSGKGIANAFSREGAAFVLFWIAPMIIGGIRQW